MTARVPLRASAVVLALAMTSIAPNALAADPKKEAQALFEMAVKQADAGDNAAALSSFRASYQKYSTYKTLYNIGKVCARMGDAPCAVRSFEQYLRDGDKEISAKRRREVEAEVKSLSRTLATVTVKSNLNGADVMVDDVVVGKTPLSGSLPIGGGPHKVSVVLDGQRVDRNITVVAGESASLVLDADKEKASSAKAEPAAVPAPETKKEEPEPEPEPARPATKEEPKPFPVVPWAVTGALAAGTVITGILASSAYGTYTDKKGEYPVTRDDLDSAQGTARDLFVLSSVLGACTIVSAGIAAYFTFFGASSSSGPPPSKARIGLGFGPGGISVNGVMP